MPPAMDMYPFEVQMAFFIHGLLQDTWDGMSGYYMGKNMSGLGELLDIYEIEDKKTVVFFLKHIDSQKATSINEEVRRKSKEASRKAKR